MTFNTYKECRREWLRRHINGDGTPEPRDPNKKVKRKAKKASRKKNRRKK